MAERKHGAAMSAAAEEDADAAEGGAGPRTLLLPPPPPGASSQLRPHIQRQNGTVQLRSASVFTFESSDETSPSSAATSASRRERNFPSLDLKEAPPSLDSGGAIGVQQPVLVIHSPKTPTLSRKVKAVSLDSEPPKPSQAALEIGRDVFSMPNTPKKQTKIRYLSEFDDGGPPKSSLSPCFGSNLKRFASNTSISGSQTLKTLPEIMTLQDFSDNRTEPVRVRAKGLLERRGSNASLTIDLGAVAAAPASPTQRLNAAKSVSNLNLTSFGANGNRCECNGDGGKKVPMVDRRKSQTHLETCGNCTIYESVPSKSNACKSGKQAPPAQHNHCTCICSIKCARKSLSNENLYVPPCCNFSGRGAGSVKQCRGHRRACYPRQTDPEASRPLSEDFKTHLQNVQYLQTAGSVLSVIELKHSCEAQRVPKLHQEFWEVPLNLQEKCLVPGSQTRNRYRGVLPNEHSRVHLNDMQPYIHANYIKGYDYTETAYIATQGPMSHTCEDFWEMVWLTKSNCVVMLTQLVEKGRNKCELYFPLGKRSDVIGKSYYIVKSIKVPDRFTFDRNTKRAEEVETVRHEEVNEVVFGKYRIKYVSKDNLNECVIRKLVLERIDGAKKENRKITHYWYPSWQDHKLAEPRQVLQMALHVLDFLDNHSKIAKSTVATAAAPCGSAAKKKNDVKSRTAHSESRLTDGSFKQTFEHFQKLDAASSVAVGGEQRRRSVDDRTRCPLVVHCSAGIGRTGCFLAVLNGIRQLRCNYNVDVLAILCSLRLHRGGMVQTAEQYELIHRVLSLYAESM